MLPSVKDATRFQRYTAKLIASVIAGGYVWWRSKNMDQGWAIYDEKVIRVTQGTVQCRRDPEGLSGAMWGEPMAEGVWKWTIKKQGDGVEVGVCSSAEFNPSYPFKAIKKEAPSWRGVTSMHLNHSGTHTNHHMTVPTNATFDITYNADNKEISFDSEGGTISMGAPDTPVHPVVRFTRSGTVEMVSPPQLVNE